MITCKLDGKSIDEIAELLTKTLSEKRNARDVLRLRLSVEEVMGYWASKLGEEVICTCESGKSFGRNYLILKVAGEKVDPRDNDELNLGLLNAPNILSALGMVVQYDYKDNTNILKVQQPKSAIVKFLPTALCFCCPLIFGFSTRHYAPNIADGLFNYLVDPLFSKIMDLLGLIAGPLIFLSLFAGIIGIGDKATFDKLGKKSCARFIWKTFTLLFITIGLCLLCFPVAGGGDNNILAGLSSAFVLILDIIPGDIVSPFLNGNAMQIVFLAVVLGLICLALGDLVKQLGDLIVQLSVMVQGLMSSICDLMSGFMVVSLLDLSLSGDSVDVSSLMKFVVLLVLFCLLYLIISIGYICLKYKVKPIQFIKSVTPSALMVFMTASLPSVLGMNMDACVKDLKIKKRFVNFCVPFGQIVYKPATGLCYLLTALCLAEYAKVEITPIFLITCFLLCSVLAVATPPIPGGAIGSLAILFAQLGIPATAIALAINLTLLMDNTCALTNDVCFIAETLSLAEDLDMKEK